MIFIQEEKFMDWKSLKQYLQLTENRILCTNREEVGNTIWMLLRGLVK